MALYRFTSIFLTLPLSSKPHSHVIYFVHCKKTKLLRGAALNAVVVAEKMVENGALKAKAVV
jgi:hypothetical protein